MHAWGGAAAAAAVPLHDGRLTAASPCVSIPRPADGTLKLWDLRKLKGGPLATADGLPCSYSMTQCCFSPDEDKVLTGTSAEGKDAAGALVVLSADTLTKLGETAVEGSAVAVQWHPRINQIFVGCGGRSSGCVRTFYDPGEIACSDRGLLVLSVALERAQHACWPAALLNAGLIRPLSFSS